MSVEGTWYNAFGSTLNIGQVVDGAFFVTYETAVSSGQCAQGTFPGSGFFSASGSVLGFTVLWTNSGSDCKSVTTWSGVYDPTSDSITAIWLLTADSPETPWAPTSVGEDQFHRRQSAEAVQRAGRMAYR